MKAAIIGMGVVGKAQARLFAGYDLITYDSAWGSPYPRDAIGGCDFAVITVGTPPREDGSADLTAPGCRAGRPARRAAGADPLDRPARHHCPPGRRPPRPSVLRTRIHL